MAKKIKEGFNYVPTKREVNAMCRCIDNRITVYPLPVGNQYKLVIMRANGYKQMGKQTFNSRTDEWVKKIYELYLILEKKL